MKADALCRIGAIANNSLFHIIFIIILGDMYRYGHGYKADHKKAREFFQQSAELGSTLATRYLSK